MTPERLRQIEELYHSAREHGTAVLSGTDPDLRREVEKLLAQDGSGRILDRPAQNLLAEMTETWYQTGIPPELGGRTLGHYLIEETLGAGGMGVVYKAYDTRLNRRVALKFLPPHLRYDPELKARLVQEARAASALDHPNIVVIHDIHESEDEIFIAMAFHEGETLRQKIRGPLPLTDALQIARQCALGLAKAHEHGIIHRDIKPSNIVVAKDGIVRIIDFGLAKSIDTASTLDGNARGTPLYMSPEQAAGGVVDFRTDIWSLGVVLYEMLVGTSPFRGESIVDLIRQVTKVAPPPLGQVRPEVPVDVQELVSRALEKDPDKRYQSAAEMERALSAAFATLQTEARPHSRLRPVYIAAAALLLLAAAGLFWLYQRSQQRLWARERALPQISELKDNQKPVAAGILLRQARKVLPLDPQLERLATELTHSASIHSSPSGAYVEIKDYVTPDAPWTPLGTTPFEKTLIPSGYLRWRVSKSGLPSSIVAPITKDMMGYVGKQEFALDALAQAPQGMVFVPAGEYFDIIWSLGELGPFDLPAYYIDKLEVTNRQFQAFVDGGGYRERRFWKHKFIQNGRELSWEQGMGLFRDTTGRPGPSTWAGGRFPEGQADHPVGGVSWFEAAAYAEFAGKSLPAIAQWSRAAPSSLARFIISQSNFSKALAPAGKYPGLGPYGTYDMAGNIAEWCLNESSDGGRFQLGGAYDTAAAEYFEPSAFSPFHRGANAGFRCVRNSGALPKEALSPRKQSTLDFSATRPVGDDVFRVYKSLYSYDRTPLNASIEPVAQDSREWKKERITFDAAYGSERVTVYLFLPAGTKPPYQTVILHPTARAALASSSESLVDMNFIDYVIQSGRAVAYPVYKGTYERAAPLTGPDTPTGRDRLIQSSKDLGRTIDYLETRSDIDPRRIAYMGVSMGAAYGVVLAGVEERLRGLILLDGGFVYEEPLPGTNQVDFAARIRMPVLMISGKYDWVYWQKDALLNLMATPPADKKLVLFDTAHDVSERGPHLRREVLSWLDRHLGRIL